MDLGKILDSALCDLEDCMTHYKRHDNGSAAFIKRERHAGMAYTRAVLELNRQPRNHQFHNRLDRVIAKYDAAVETSVISESIQEELSKKIKYLELMIGNLCELQEHHADRIKDAEAVVHTTQQQYVAALNLLKEQGDLQDVFDALANAYEAKVAAEKNLMDIVEDILRELLG
jgi:hypothetical protein